MTAPHATVAPSSTTPKTPTTDPTSAHSSPPARPTVPADVPRTGPNTRKGEKPPVMPLAATKHTAAGAQAFAEFFIKTIDWGYATTSSAYMRHYFTSSCIACVSTARALDRADELHRHFIGDRFAIRQVARAGRLSVSVHFDVTAVETVTKRGRPVGGYPALSNFREQLFVRWHISRWIVARMAPHQ
jgi:hypothetical protein